MHLRVPPKLVLTGAGGRHYLLLSKEAQLQQRHIDPHTAEDAAATTIGEVV